MSPYYHPGETYEELQYRLYMEQELRQDPGDNPWEGIYGKIFSSLGGPVSLSMYSAGFTGLDASSSRSSGFRLTDTAGLISSQNALVGYRSFDSGGGINLSIDTTRLLDLNANQRLWFGLTTDFHYDSATYTVSGLAPGQANANAGSSRSNISTVTGYANYTINNLYFNGRASFDFNHTDITNNLFIPGAQGNVNGRGYSLNATVGELFPLFNPVGLNPAIIVKGVPTIPGGYALFLDMSGHYIYRHESADGFTDTTGFTYGTQQLSYGDVGARARLTAVIPAGRGFAWMPFVGVTVDRQLGYSSTFDIPAQAALPADTTIFTPATTWWGAELGLDILTRGGAKFGMKAFYQASADSQTVGGSAFLRISLWDPATAQDSGIRIMSRGRDSSPLVVKGPLVYAPVLYSWTGFYIGAHVGGALGIAKFDDPFGSPIYGDSVRSPAFVGGGQIGYNWQVPGSRWVLGAEADGSIIESDGGNTCFAVSAATINTTCRVRPQAISTLTGRVGYVFGPAGRTLIYAKGGLAWARDRIDMAVNTAADEFQFGGVPRAVFASIPSNSQSVNLWGGTVGVGVEYALNPAWSLRAEYDYVGLSGNVANLGSANLSPILSAPFTILAVTPPGTSGVSQSFQEVKLGLNYKWGADPWATGWNTGLGIPSVLPATGWEVEGGGRYFGSWGQFKKTFGLLESLGAPQISDLSRLTYDNMQTHSGEFFGRIETPWNLFIKGNIGGGGTYDGHMNDEDNVIFLSPIVAAYSNTLSPSVTGQIRYGTIDGGFDFLRGAGYTVGVFAGYFTFNQFMNAFGCVPVASINCTPNPIPTSGSPVITEDDKWRATRVGVAAEAMLTERVKVAGEAVYLPWVWFKGLDQHFFANTGVLAEVFPTTGRGSGVQLEVQLSYYLTPQWSVGVGGRYWGMWTKPDGQLTCTFGCGPPPPQPQFFRAQVEQLGAFVQTSYKFDWGSTIAALR
jgi:opacity protein-like surface antigen